MTLKDSTSEDCAKRVAPSAKLVTASSYDEAVRLLFDGEANAMVADRPVCVLTVLRNPTRDLATPSAPFSVEPIGIALPVDDERLFNLVDTYIDAFEKTGLLEDLRKKWLQDSDWLALLP